MKPQDFKDARTLRLLTTPAWWLDLAARNGGPGVEVSGDDLAKNQAWARSNPSFSKSPDSPRFPTPPFARVQG